VIPHVYVHGWSYDYGGCACKIQRCEEIVGDAAGEFRKDIGGGGRDEQQIGALRYCNVLDGAFEVGFAAGLREEIGNYLLAAQCGEGQGSNEFAGAAGHDDLNGEGVLLKAAD
jgi:hypothetical protein